MGWAQGVATVSYARVFAWFGISILTTMSAMLLWWIHGRTEKVVDTGHDDEAIAAATKETKKELMHTHKELKDLPGVDDLIGMFKFF
jgi:hypothetical protein